MDEDVPECAEVGGVIATVTEYRMAAALAVWLEMLGSKVFQIG